MDLFSIERDKILKTDAPLAQRVRPKTLEDFFGQDSVIAKDKLLYRAIKADRITSIILYGPPGTGKTTLATIIANSTKSNFVKINATTSGIKDIKETVEEAKSELALYGKKTILFIDEIHRFNKSQQDALLPHVEQGLITLIGATTENPYFEVNNALLSRSTIFKLEKLSEGNIKDILIKAIEDKENGLGHYDICIDDDAMDFLCSISNGDARNALNALELAVLTTDPNKDGVIKISIDIVKESTQQRGVSYDKDGDNHYDTISAFIKSMRGSDPDATVYYLAKMLYAGEDVKFIARRILIAASEDVGLANNEALVVATSAMQAVQFVGLPEARIILSHAALAVCLSPKSNSAYNAIDDAYDIVSKSNGTIPSHLRDSHYSGAVDLGHGHGYMYPHAYPNHYIEQQYLPDELLGLEIYHPADNKREQATKNYFDSLKN